jgi:hypothetical protein
MPKSQLKLHGQRSRPPADGTLFATFGDSVVASWTPGVESDPVRTFAEMLLEAHDDFQNRDLALWDDTRLVAAVGLNEQGQPSITQFLPRYSRSMVVKVRMVPPTGLGPDGSMHQRRLQAMREDAEINAARRAEDDWRRDEVLKRPYSGLPRVRPDATAPKPKKRRD